jgi:hypothetical protein
MAQTLGEWLSVEIQASIKMHVLLHFLKWAR